MSYGIKPSFTYSAPTHRIKQHGHFLSSHYTSILSISDFLCEIVGSGGLFLGLLKDDSGHTETDFRHWIIDEIYTFNGPMLRKVGNHISICPVLWQVGQKDGSRRYWSRPLGIHREVYQLQVHFPLSIQFLVRTESKSDARIHDIAGFRKLPDELDHIPCKRTPSTVLPFQRRMGCLRSADFVRIGSNMVLKSGMEEAFGGNGRSFGVLVVKGATASIVEWRISPP